jgi:hypothetical protein
MRSLEEGENVHFGLLECLPLISDYKTWLYTLCEYSYRDNHQSNPRLIIVVGAGSVKVEDESVTFLTMGSSIAKY